MTLDVQRPSGPPIAETLQGRHLLVTGFTGFVAKVWVTHLLWELPDIRLTLVVRGRRSESAAARVRRIVETSPALRPLRERHGDGLLAFLRDRIEVVDGDVSEPGFALPDAILERLAGQLDAVVHCAGLTDFAPDPRKALEANVLGAAHAADVAAKTRGRRLVHVSTSFVAGMVSGEVPEATTLGVSPNGTRFSVEAEVVALESACDAIDEREGRAKSPAARQARVDVASARARALGWPNVYTYSKGLAEQLLLARDDIDLTVVRPSIIECAREFPFPGWNEGLNTSGPIVWMCSGYAWKVPMRAGHHFDVIPVDTAVRGLTLAVSDALSGRAEAVYHLASGDHHPLTFGRALDLTALKVRKGYFPSEIGPLERVLLSHLDSTALDKPADRSLLLPAAKHTAKFLRDQLLHSDVDKWLPRGWSAENKTWVAGRVRTAGLRMNLTHSTLKTIESLWKLYQPFIHDHNYEFVTANVRRRTAELSDDDRARFGWDLETLDWRDYWMNVEIPGLDKWSLPLIRGHEVPQDSGFDLGGDLVEPTEGDGAQTGRRRGPLGVVR